MQKKMVRIIGVVAVVLLIVVAMAGAASAYKVTIPQTDVTHKMTYTGYVNGSIQTGSSFSANNGDTVKITASYSIDGISGYVVTAADWSGFTGGVGTHNQYSFTVGSSDVTVTASETEATLKVTYDGNGAASGTVPAEPSWYAVNEEVTVLGNTGNLYKTGYTFDGWTMTTDGSDTVYGPGDNQTHTFTITEDTTLSAKWNSATFYYVDSVGGNDSNKGISPDSPLKTIKQALKNSGSGSVIQLINNNIQETISVTKKVTLDLNGYVLQATDNNRVISVNNGGDLTIVDSNSGNQSHHFSEDENGLWIWDNTEQSSAHVLTGGVITGANNTTNIGGGVTVSSSSDKFTLLSGNIVGNTARNGGGVNNNGIFTMDGGCIAGNTCNDDKSGGGVYNSNMFTMNNGTIKNNKAGKQGGGIFNQNSTFSMTGGNIVGNTAQYGGGVSNNTGGRFIMTGGRIVENTSTSGNDGGVRHVGLELSIGGTAYIMNNTNSSGYSANVFLKSGTTIQLLDNDDILTGSAMIGVRGDATDKTAVSSNYPVTSPQIQWEQYFSSDDEKRNIGLDGGVLKFDNTTKSVTGISLSPASATITVGGELTLVATVSPVNASNKEVTWASSDESVVTVENGLVNGISPGTVTITVTSKLDSKSDECTVIVSSPQYEFSIPDSITVPEQLNGYNTGVVTLSTDAQIDGYYLNLRLSTDADSTGEYDNKTLDLFHLTKTGSSSVGKYSMEIYQHNSDKKVKDVTGCCIVAQLNLGDSGSKSVTYDLRYIARVVPTESGTYSGTLTFEVSPEKITS